MSKQNIDWISMQHPRTLSSKVRSDAGCGERRGRRRSHQKRS